MSPSLDLIQTLKKKIALCGVCHGRSHYLVEGKGVVDCQCLRDAKYELALCNSGIPPRFQHLEFKDYMYKNSKTFQEVQKYVSAVDYNVSKGCGLFLYGGKQTGKTLLAIGILKEMMRLGYSVGFTLFSGVLSQPDLCSVYVGEEKTFACLDDVSRVLDNLVNFRESVLTHTRVNGAVLCLEEILNRRVMSKLPIILTSSVSRDVIVKEFPSLEAILTGCFADPIECVTGDFRSEKAQTKAISEVGFDQIT